MKKTLMAISMLSAAAACQAETKDPMPSNSGGSPTTSGAAAGEAPVGATGGTRAGNMGGTDDVTNPNPRAGAAGENMGGSNGDSSGGSNSAGEAGNAGAAGAPAWQLRALTYNTALAPGFEPFVDEREPKIRLALAEAAKSLDVLCVQEYWSGEQFKAMSDALASELGTAYRQEPRVGGGSCSPDDLTSLGVCLETKCEGKTGFELVQCAQLSCDSEIKSVDGGCLGCFLDHIDDAKFEACLDDAPRDPALFRGTFDVGLLSRYPLLQKAALEYDSYFVRASALYAQLDVPGLGPVDTFCTHLGSSLGDIPYQGPHGSWEGEHAYQMGQLVAFIAAKTDGRHPVLVLGDLNTGPAGEGWPPISAELPLDYQLLVSSGLQSAVAEPHCTLCQENVLRGPDSRALWLDHAMIKGFSSDISTSLALTETFPLAMPGGDIPMNLSDHYGLRVELGTTE